jgi:membrane-associated progesterone receptor component
MSVSSLSERLDQWTGWNGTLGYIVIISLFLVVNLMMSTTSNPHKADTKESSAQGHNPSKPKEDEDEPDPPRNFTLEQLHKFNGSTNEKGDKASVYLSLNGTVFDVSEGADFYGPGGPYECFAGHECGIALAKMSFDDTHVDDLENVMTKLNHGERCELENWIDKFTNYRRYPVLGKLVPSQTLPDPDRVLSKEELAQHDGTSTGTDIQEGYATPPIYLGAGTKVYDVSFGGVGFYGPDGGYHRFAGKNASRALAKMSFDPADVEDTSVTDLTDAQRKVLADWVKTFETRKQYPIVGRLA